MSKKSVNCGTAGGPVGAEVKFAGNDSKSKMYEPKHKKKLIRVLTVIAYIFSVSLAAITLSLFYLFIYNPGKPGQGVGSSNGSTNERSLGASNEGMIIPLNNTYSAYEREEPRALPLETKQPKKITNGMQKKSRNYTSKANESHINPVTKSFSSQLIGTLAVT